MDAFALIVVARAPPAASALIVLAVTIPVGTLTPDAVIVTEVPTFTSPLKILAVAIPLTIAPPSNVGGPSAFKF